MKKQLLIAFLLTISAHIYAAFPEELHQPCSNVLINGTTTNIKHELSDFEAHLKHNALSTRTKAGTFFNLHLHEILNTVEQLTPQKPKRTIISSSKLAKKKKVNQEDETDVTQATQLLELAAPLGMALDLFQRANRPQLIAGLNKLPLHMLPLSPSFTSKHINLINVSELANEIESLDECKQIVENTIYDKDINPVIISIRDNITLYGHSDGRNWSLDQVNAITAKMLLHFINIAKERQTLEDKTL